MPRELDLLTILSLAHRDPGKWVLAGVFPDKHQMMRRIHAGCVEAHLAHWYSTTQFYHQPWWFFVFHDECLYCGSRRYP